MEVSETLTKLPLP